MSKADKMRDQIKRASGDKKIAEELDRMRDDEVEEAYISLRSLGRYMHLKGKK